MGKSVVVVCPDKHLGGLSSGGLGFTDTGNKAVIGGLSRDFYHRVWKHYDEPETWVWQKRDEYGNKGQGTPAMDGEHRPCGSSSRTSPSRSSRTTSASSRSPSIATGGWTARTA